MIRFLLPATLLVAACSPDTESRQAAAAKPNPPPAAPETTAVPFKQLGWDGSRYTFKPQDASEAKPYTGITTDHYKSGQLKARYGLKDGVYHGLVEEWYENGRQKTKTSYENGQHQGDNFYWNSDGTLQVHKVWKDNDVVSETRPAP